MTDPAGNPYWERTTGYTDYGGHENKINYAGQAIINQRTDIGAEHLMRLSADLAAITRMANFCVMTLTMSTGTNAPTVTACRLGTAIYQGSGYVGDSPPTGFPTVEGVSDGIATITFSAAYADPYGVSANYTAEFPRSSSHESGVHTAAKMTGAVVYVYAVDSASKAAVTGKTVTVTVA